MKVTLVCLLLLGNVSLFLAQESSPSPGASVSVQRLIKFSGTLTDSHRPGFVIGAVSLRFTMYSEPEGGEAFWRETQNVRPDAQGRYTVLLGETTLGGLPLNIFASGGTRWLGLQASGQSEQPRILLVELPSTWEPDSISTSAPVSKRSILPNNPTERHLAMLLLVMFLAGTALACMEVVKWWKRRLEQYGPPPFANLITYISGPDRRWQATAVLTFPLAERLRSIRGRFQHLTPCIEASIEDDRPKKAA